MLSRNWSEHRLNILLYITLVTLSSSLSKLMKPFGKNIPQTITLPPPIWRLIHQHHVSKMTNYRVHQKKTVSHCWIRYVAMGDRSQSIHELISPVIFLRNSQWNLFWYRLIGISHTFSYHWMVCSVTFRDRLIFNFEAVTCSFLFCNTEIFLLILNSSCFFKLVGGLLLVLFLL